MHAKCIAEVAAVDETHATTTQGPHLITSSFPNTEHRGLRHMHVSQSSEQSKHGGELRF